MTQLVFNEIIKCIVFTLSTDACMDTPTSNSIETLEVMMRDNPELAEGLALDDIYLFGSSNEDWCTPEINTSIIKVLGDKLKIEKF